jgi:hypothetical protein
MIVGFLALCFLHKTSVLCVLDISLCDHGLNFRKNIGRSDSVFNNGIKLLDQENRRKYIKCIQISTCISC